jgi:hypothetical protein
MSKNRIMKQEPQVGGRKHEYTVDELDVLIERLSRRVERLEGLKKRLKAGGAGMALLVDGHQSLYTRGFKSFDLFINNLSTEIDLANLD